MVSSGVVVWGQGLDGARGYTGPGVISGLFAARYSR